MKIPSLDRLASGGTKNTFLLGVVGIIAGVGISFAMKKIGNPRSSYLGYWGEGRDPNTANWKDPMFGAAQSGGFYGQFLMNKNDEYLHNSLPYAPHSIPPPISRNFAAIGSNEERCTPFTKSYF